MNRAVVATLWIALILFAPRARALTDVVGSAPDTSETAAPGERGDGVDDDGGSAGAEAYAAYECPGETCAGDCVTGCSARPAAPSRDIARFGLLAVLGAGWLLLRRRTRRGASHVELNRIVSK